MKHINNIYNKIKYFYTGHPAVIGYIFKFIVSLIALLILRENVRFNEFLSNVFFVLFFAVVCAFMPAKFVLLALAAYIVVQLFGLSAGIGIVACALVVLIYLLNIRFDERKGFVIILIPLLCMIKLPLLIPLVLAVTASLGTCVNVLLGLLVYYFIHYIHINIAVFQGLTDSSELVKMSMTLSGIFSYREMLFTIACVLIAFFAAYYLKKININQSNSMGIFIGGGVFLILVIISNLMFETITYQKLIWYVIGTLISCVAAVIISYIILPLDFNRTELLEFEDDEYKYYVRAVPKVAIATESVRVKRIYARKQAGQQNGKEGSN